MNKAAGLSIKFGYWPQYKTVSAGDVFVGPLSDYQQTVDATEKSDGIDGQWIYAPLQQTRHFPSGRIIERPFTSRIFGLPKTHFISHGRSNSPDHLEFLIWCLSLFSGIRLTSTEAGFVDATPIKSGKLNDFVVLGRFENCVELAESFWINNLNFPQRADLVAGAIHTLFLSQGPQLLQYERFIYCYTALDTCFALAADLYPSKKRITHSARMEWMCNLFGMPVPDWAAPASKGSSSIAVLRNATMHEARYMGQPLGFALHGVGTNQNLPLEMKGLICRLLVALLGASKAKYVTTLVNTRQRIGLQIS